MVKIAKKLTAAFAAAAMCFTMLPALSAGAEGAHTITVTTDGNGTASSTHTSLTAGESYTLTATPNEGYEFDHWEVRDDGTGVGVKKANIAFVLDVSGSMSNDIRKVRDNLDSFVNELSKQGVIVNSSVITYGSSKSVGDQHSYADGSNWSTDTAATVQIFDNILKKGTGGANEYTGEAFKFLVNSNGTVKFPSTVNNFIFVLTDEDCDEYSKSDPNSSDPGKWPLSKYTDVFSAGSVKVAVVAEDDKECHKGSGKNSGYDDIVAATKGTYIDIDTKDYYKLMVDYAKFVSDSIITVGETYTSNPCTAIMPDCNIITKAYFKKTGTPSAVSYNINVVTSGRGTAYASTSKAAPGEKISIFNDPESGWLLDGITSDEVSISENTFTMPAKDVTVHVRFTEDYSMFIVNGRARSYIFSYDESGKLIATNSSRKYDKNIGTVSVTVKLGTKYAGRSCVLYTGKSSSGGSVVDEAVLDEEGRATFTVEEGENFHLLFSE